MVSISALPLAALLSQLAQVFYLSGNCAMTASYFGGWDWCYEFKQVPYGE